METKCQVRRNNQLFITSVSRLGESPYNVSININSIMKGNDSWDSVTRKNHRKGRKLPDLGCSPEAVKEISPDKTFITITSLFNFLFVIFKNIISGYVTNT